ncbi:uncharacterized protein LOC124819143 [Hydra vulgaris]|uniref:uncharacterized protein LOC124819143 n=1 Tax=Hydra vulgaris TaxID=6087 RepID=UPI001F5F262F|nr:uncharacterized protein LOC124819143 [Hydra vulgaris]
MHFGEHNKNFEYFIKDSKLDSTTNEKDIGLLISNTMKWNQHVYMVVNKANSRLGLLSKSFTYKDKNTMKILYCTFVRPILEYASPIWNPYNTNDIHKLEIVQQRATKLIPELRHLPYEERLKKLQLSSLKIRRLRYDLIQYYKMFHNLDKVCWYQQPKIAISISANGPASNIRGDKARVDIELIKRNRPRENFFTK